MRRISTGKKQMKNAIIRLPLNGKKESKSLESWILEHPDVVYNHVYRARALNLKRLQLTRDNVLLLKTELQKQHPSLLAELNSRKQQKTLKARIKKQEWIKKQEQMKKKTYSPSGKIRTRF